MAGAGFEPVQANSVTSGWRTAFVSKGFGVNAFSRDLRPLQSSRVLWNLFALRAEDRWFYVASDVVGSPRIVVDTLATPVEVREYDGWGNVTSEYVGRVLAVGFSNGLADAETGLVRYGFRDYVDAHKAEILFRRKVLRLLRDRRERWPSSPEVMISDLSIPRAARRSPLSSE